MLAHRAHTVDAVFLLVTGASGTGKTTVRRRLEGELAPAVRCVELGQVVAVPAWPDVAWRQRATEAVVVLALEEQAHGRHLLLAGDPVAPGEVLAAPSADRLDDVAGLLLDCAAGEQRRRLTARGEPPAALDDHVAFADWMRRHVRDPRHRPEVITAGGWVAMHWARWTGWPADDPRRRFETLDTTALTPAEVAAAALAWVRRALDSSLRHTGNPIDNAP